MSHLGQDHLYAAVFNRVPLAAADEQHLAQCAACRRAYDELAALRRELALARAAAPTAAVIDRYTALFASMQQRPLPLQALWRSFTALLAWDSRQQTTLQGVRSSATGLAAGSYRLLYASGGGEVELLVESDGPSFRVQGEILAQEGTDGGPALVQWFGLDGVLRHEAESGAEGQFALRGVQPGQYRLFILSAAGDSIEIEMLEIA